MTKLQQLIDKWDNHIDRDKESRGHNIEQIIIDLKSLKEEEPKEVEEGYDYDDAKLRAMEGRYG